LQRVVSSNFTGSVPRDDGSAVHSGCKDSTDGGIAVTHKEIDEIWPMVKTGTRVEIRPCAHLAHPKSDRGRSPFVLTKSVASIHRILYAV